MNELLLEFLDSILNERSKYKMRTNRMKNSTAAEKAKLMGLERKPGFGNYGKPGSKQITHRSVSGELVPVGQPERGYGDHIIGNKGIGFNKQKLSLDPQDQPDQKNVVRGTQTPSKPTEEPEPQVKKTELSPEISKKLVMDLTVRLKIASTASKNTDNDPKDREKFTEYATTIQKVIDELNKEQPSLQEIRTILNNNGITTFQELIKSPVFRTSRGAYWAHELAKVLNAHTLPGGGNILDGEYDPRVDNSSLVSTQRLFPEVTDDQLKKPSAKGFTLGNSRLEPIDIESPEIQEKLNKLSKRNRSRALLRIREHNLTVDFIRENGEDGFLELPKGEEGASLLQDRLEQQLMQEKDKEMFRGHMQQLRSAKKPRDKNTAWKNLKKFLEKTLPDTTPIPAICEQLKAIDILSTDPNATVVLPWSGRFPVGDIIVIRQSNPTPEIETITCTINSVKRKKGAPAQFEQQLKLTVFKDDRRRRGTRARDVLSQLVYEEEIDATRIDQIAQEFDITFLGEEDLLLRTSRARLDKIRNCMCPNIVEKPCDEESVKKAAVIFSKKEYLFEQIYKTRIGKQLFRNTTFEDEQIAESDGLKKKSKIKPDYRVHCVGGKLKHNTRESGKKSKNVGRVYIITED